MRPVTLKGTQDGYELILNQSAGISEIYTQLGTLLTNLNHKGESATRTVDFDILTGNRLFTKNDVKNLRRLFNKFPDFVIHKIISNVITITDSYHIKEQDSVHVMDRTIRNGQDYRMHGDVLFLGDVHKGGKLYTDGNIYLMGNVEGIVHAGFPNSESKLIIGDLHNAQQVRIGEQFDVVADRQISASNQTVAYVNDLHVLSYGKINDLKHIDPRLYNRIGGIM